MGLVLRVTGIVLAVSSVLVLAGLVLGQIMATDAVTDHYTLEGRTYQLEIRDTQRTFRVRLAGTRCFAALPPWAEDDGDIPNPDQEGQFWQLRFAHALDAVTHIRCVR